MADFVPTTVNKTAVRELVIPIADVASFNTLVETFIAANPTGCVGHTARDGVEVAPIFRNREHYTLMSEVRRRRYQQAARDRLGPGADDRRV